MSILTLTGLGILEEFVAPGRPNRPGTSITPTTVTIHNTSNTSPGAGARAHSNFIRNTGFYIHNGNKNWVSWHFTVDDKAIIQHLPTNEKAYHAGSAANGSSIAIEICMNPESSEAGANAKAAALCAALLSGMGLGVNALRRHQDWTGKACPTRLLTPAKWNAFIEAVRTKLGASASLIASAAADDPNDDAEIDHDALELALGQEVATGLFSPRVPDDPAGMVRGVVNSLAGPDAAGGTRLLFPHGITELALTLPAGISLTVKGPQTGSATSLALGDHHHTDHDYVDHKDDEPLCTAPERRDGSVAAVAEPVDEEMPDSGPGFYSFSKKAKRFGTKSTIQAVKAVAAAYLAATGLRLGVGNISISGGGTMPPHKSHKRGIDVDIRVPRSDGLEAAATWKSSAYSRQNTQLLVDLFRSNTEKPVRTILFNDPLVAGVSPFSGHDNHLHVNFQATLETALSKAGDGSHEARAPAIVTASRLAEARARSGGDLDDVLAATGTAQVLLPIQRSTSSSAAAAATQAIDDSFMQCFEAPDYLQMESLSAAAASIGPSGGPGPVRGVTVYPRLGLALGTVHKDKVTSLREHRMVRDGNVMLAPTLSLIRPLDPLKAAAPKGAEWGIERLGVRQAWDAGFDGSGVIVGHLDTGIDATHPVLAGALHSYAEFDLAGRHVSGAPPRDSATHGTHTAGTIAGRSRIGVAPGCQLASAMVIEYGDVIARILGGLDWIVDQGAKVLSMSLGLRGYTDNFQVVIDGLWENDVLPVIAVGNEYANSSRSPGNYINVLSVGAMGINERVADFSSSQRFNRLIDPLVPDLVAPGVDVLSCLPGGGYGKMSGSSMATPHVAGVAAILRQAAANLSARDIEAAILASCIRPASMPGERANQGVPDVMRALAILGVIPAKVATRPPRRASVQKVRPKKATTKAAA